MSINEIYLDGEYADNNPLFHVEDSAWKAEQIYRGINAASLSPKTIAEVGCGAGEILVQLAEKIPETKLTGFEISPQGFGLCKGRATGQINYVNSDVFSNEDKFDLMLCIDVFEHIEDYFAFLRKLKLKADTFVFHIPLDMNAQMVARSNPIQRVRESVGHIHYFSKDSALSVLNDCGYEVLEWFYTPNGIDKPKSSKAKLMQIPRKILQSVSQEMTARILGGYSLLVVAKPRPK